jgi:glyoxylase-like metal-dependent hydrolase (beta-lactamase superfamily II)
MRRVVMGLLSIAVAFANAPTAAQSTTSAVLDAAETAMGITGISSVQYSGSGSSYFVGQSPAPGGPWLHYVLKSYVADIDYTTPSMRQELDRIQDDGGTPFGGTHQIWNVSGRDAWNLTGDSPAPQYRDPSGNRTAEQRALEIWLTPAGFVKAARANNATVRMQGAKKIVTFTMPDRHRIIGTIDAQNLIEKTETVIDNPVVGDMPISMTFSGYQTFNGVKFPTKIVESIGGGPALELTVASVKPNGATAIGETPTAARNVQPAHTVAKSEKIADGVWYITGASHHSVLVEFADHLVVLEAPQDDDRSNAVIAEIRKLVPSKPIRYVVNTHSHFDHLGGVRAYAAEGATILGVLAAKPYYEKVLNAPHTINPDTLSKTGKRVNVQGVDGTRILTDGAQTVELHVFKMTHSQGMLLPYLPKLKMLVQADLQVAPPPNTTAPVAANPVALELYNQIEARKMDVAQIAGIHGRVTTWKQLETAAGK